MNLESDSGRGKVKKSEKNLSQYATVEGRYGILGHPAAITQFEFL
jgi:hypothetical protein